VGGFEKLSVAAFVLALIAFIAAGNPHIVEEQNKHSELDRLEVGDGDVVGAGVKTVNTIKDVACTDGAKIGHKTDHSLHIAVPNRTSHGYCYYTQAWETKSQKLVFYGFDLSTFDDVMRHQRGENW